MTYRIAFDRQAKRALDQQLPQAVAAACAEFIFGALAENPHRVGKQLGPPHLPAYSARRGDFRVIYEIRDEEVLIQVISVRHRRDAYRTPYQLIEPEPCSRRAASAIEPVSDG